MPETLNFRRFCPVGTRLVGEVSGFFLCCAWALRFVSATVWRLGSALRVGGVACLTVAFRAGGAGVLSFASPKESSQRKGDPRVGARYAGPLRYSKPAGAAELGPAGLKQSSPSFRRFLCCSAPLRGRKNVAAEPLKMVLAVFQRSTAKKHLFCFFLGRAFVPRRFSGSPCGAPSNAAAGGKARGLSEARRAEFRSARQQRVAQGSRRSRPRSLGSPSSLATFFLAKQEESTPARKAEPPRKTRAASSVSETPRRSATADEKQGVITSPPGKSPPIPPASSRQTRTSPPPPA